MRLPELMSRELLGLIIDDVFEGAVEDCSPIFQIYKCIAKYFNAKPPLIEWRHICELTEDLFLSEGYFLFWNIEYDNPYSIGIRFCTPLKEAIMIDGIVYKFEELKEVYTHYALLTPPEGQ